MTVTYHAGRRIQGLDADRTATQLPLGSVGGWVELGRTTLGSANANITVSSLADKRYLMILTNSLGRSGTSTNGYFRFNSDSGSNYSHRWSTGGGSDGTQTSQSGIFNLMVASTTPKFSVAYVGNLSTAEKLALIWNVQQSTAGATTAPARNEIVGKHAQTTNPIDTVTAYSGGAETYNTGSELVVLGWDPDDTHTNNFWEELGSGTWSSGATFDISFTSKKYLWGQFYLEAGSAFNTGLWFGNSTIDTGSNYSRRVSRDGGADTTNTSLSAMNITSGSANATPVYGSFFVINNSANEKLVICHSVRQNTALATTAPSRFETVGKWANTSNQADIIRVGSTSVDLTQGQMKLWGAD